MGEVTWVEECASRVVFAHVVTTKKALLILTGQENVIFVINPSEIWTRN
jgi:hypothetical protein